MASAARCQGCPQRFPVELLVLGLCPSCRAARGWG
jgi:hypothetical protein